MTGIKKNYKEIFLPIIWFAEVNPWQTQMQICEGTSDINCI